MLQNLRGAILGSFFFVLFSSSLLLGLAQPANSESFPFQTSTEWLRFQYNPVNEDLEKIKQTVNTYFILKYESWQKGELLDFDFLFDQQDVISAESCVYEKGLLSYLLKGWTYFNNLLQRYEYEPEFNSISIEGEQAYVNIWPKAAIFHRNNSLRADPAPWGVQNMTMISRSGCWLIREIVTDDESVQLYPYGTDFDKLSANFCERMRGEEIEDQVRVEELRLNPNCQNRFGATKSSSLSSGYRLYKDWAAAYYAKTYSSNDSGTASYNPLFQCYGPDCQNFVSQCIWYGFDGINESSYIENHNLPMISDSILAKTWWADSLNMSVWKGRHFWTVVGDFDFMVVNNLTYDGIGVQCQRGGLNGLTIGDYVKWTTLSHVAMICTIIDEDHDYTVDYNEIYICSHTSNRREARLADNTPDPTCVRLMWVLRFKNPS